MAGLVENCRNCRHDYGGELRNGNPGSGPGQALTSDGTNSYAYDRENRLVWNGSTTTSLYYDPLGRLWSMAAGAVTTRFIHDGSGELVAEYDGAGTVLRSHMHGPAADETLVTYETQPSWERRFPHADALGSVVALADNGGNAVGLNRYDEYGNPQNGSVTGRFGYTGQAWLPEIGLNYYKNRMYKPGIGFMQTDPIGYAGGANLYAYVGNDPVNFVDPSGLGLCPPGWQPSFGGGGPATGGEAGGIVITQNYICFELPGFSEPFTRAPRGTEGGGGAGGDAPIVITKVRQPPKFCSSQLYQGLNDLDALLGKAQFFVLLSAGISRTEQYRTMRLAGTAGAFEVYGWLGGARLALNVGKAFLGDYRGAITDVATRLVGKAAGVDQLGEIIGGEAGERIVNFVESNPCK